MPSTDSGVAIQFAAWATITASAVFFTRTNRDLRLLAIGLSALVAGAMTVRAVH
ncbi:MAG: hypothetical protein BMS9Abin12_1920 [Acidimicrobiia bacterium]|nr:MAG: hypothetical protein BMS9Abin12_1920 [Acidimicrobiia bacterium]